MGYGNRKAFPLENPSDVQASENLLQVDKNFKMELVRVGVIHFTRPLLRVKYYMMV